MKLALHWQILIAVMLAVIAGSWTDVETQLLGLPLYDTYVFFGQLFLNALKMLIVPLIMASIICGMAGLTNPQDLGRLGGKTLLYYIIGRQSKSHRRFYSAPNYSSVLAS